MKAFLLASTLLALGSMACSVLAGATDAATATETPMAQPSSVAPAVATATGATPIEPPPTEGPAAPPDGQEELIADWRPAYRQGGVLLETCMMMYQTHADFGQGEIDLQRAHAELEAEADFVELVRRDADSMAAASEAVAPHLVRLEELTAELIALLGSDDPSIGAPEVLSALDSSCGFLQASMDAIVGDAQAAGMSPEALDELESRDRSDDRGSVQQDLVGSVRLGSGGLSPTERRGTSS